MTDLIVAWYSSLDESQGFVLHWLVALSCIPIVERVIVRWPSFFALMIWFFLLERLQGEQRGENHEV